MQQSDVEPSPARFVESRLRPAKFANVMRTFQDTGVGKSMIAEAGSTWLARRMRNGWRRLMWAAVLATGVVAAALAIAAAVVRLPPIERWVGARVAAFLPPGMSVERASLSLLPPGLRLRNVSLSPNGPTIASIICEPSLRSTLLGHPELAVVRIPAATLTIVRDADGVHGAGAAAAPLWAAATAVGARSAPTAGAATVTWPAIRIDDAIVTLIDHTVRGDPRTLRLTNLDMSLEASDEGKAPLAMTARFEPAGRIALRGTATVAQSNAGDAVPAIDGVATVQGLDAETLLGYLAAVLPGGGSVRASGTVDGSITGHAQLDGGASGEAALALSAGSFVWDEVHVAAPLTSSAHFVASPGALALSEGRLSVAQVAAARVEATDVSAEFSYGEGALQLATAEAHAYGGIWTQTGTVTMADPPRYDMTVHAERLGCQAVLIAVTGRPPRYGCTTLTADAAVRGAWTGAKTVAQRAEGHGRIEMRGGSIPSASVIGAIWSALAPLVPRSADGDLGPPTAVEYLTDTFTLNAGRMHTTDLTLVTSDYTLKATGSIALDGMLDLDAEVAMSAAGMTRLITAAALPVPDTPGHLPSIPTRITGTVADPLIIPNAGHIPLAAVQTVLGGVRGAGNLLGTAAESGLRSLERDVRSP